MAVGTAPPGSRGIGSKDRGAESPDGADGSDDAAEADGADGSDDAAEADGADGDGEEQGAGDGPLGGAWPWALGIGAAAIAAAAGTAWLVRSRRRAAAGSAEPGEEAVGDGEIDFG